REDVAGALARRERHGGERLLVARVDQDGGDGVVALRNEQRDDDRDEYRQREHGDEALPARLEGKDVLAEIHRDSLKKRFFDEDDVVGLDHVDKALVVFARLAVGLEPAQLDAALAAARRDAAAY